MGYSTNFRKRINHHIDQARRNVWNGNSYKDNWIRSLLHLGLRPIARILEVGEGDPAPSERRWIAFYRAISPKMVNRLDGGQGGSQCLTDDGRQRIRESKLGKIPTLETRAKISMARLGKKLPPFSEEHKRKIAEALRGRKKGPLSDEHRAKVIASLIGNQRALGNDPWKNRRTVAE